MRVASHNAHITTSSYHAHSSVTFKVDRVRSRPLHLACRVHSPPLFTILCAVSMLAKVDLKESELPLVVKLMHNGKGRAPAASLAVFGTVMTKACTGTSFAEKSGPKGWRKSAVRPHVQSP